MKKAILLSFLFVLAVAPMPMADQVSVGSSYGPYQTGSGGEFTLYPSAGLQWVLSSYVDGVTKNVVVGAGLNFQTFCIEATGAEYIYKNRTYDVTISDRAIFGGMGQQGQGDPISKGTAWLYSQFQEGKLQVTDKNGNTVNYNYSGAQRTTSADLFQKAIWWLEDEGYSYNSNNPFMYAAYIKFIGDGGLGAKADNDGEYPVAILNLWVPGHVGEWDYRIQDQLVCVPAPEPATMLLLGSGLIGLAGFARKRFKK